MVDRYVNKEDEPYLKDVKNIETDDLLHVLNPCSSCTRFSLVKPCEVMGTCRIYELWCELLNRIKK